MKYISCGIKTDPVSSYRYLTGLFGKQRHDRYTILRWRFTGIANKDFEKTMPLTVFTDDSVKKVLKDATLVPANAYTPTIEVDPGDAVIYTWEEK